MEGDALWFFWLLILICDLSKSVIESNQIQTFNTEIENFANFYAIECGISRSYSNMFSLFILMV